MVNHLEGKETQHMLHLTSGMWQKVLVFLKSSKGDNTFSLEILVEQGLKTSKVGLNSSWVLRFLVH